MSKKNKKESLREELENTLKKFEDDSIEFINKEELEKSWSGFGELVQVTATAKKPKPKPKPDRPRPYKSNDEFVESCKSKFAEFIQKKGIIRYVNDWKETKKHRLQQFRVGAVVAYQEEDSVYVGWSQLHQGLDRWNKYVGVVKAIERAKDPTCPFPSELIDNVREDVVNWAAAYFKSAKRISFHMPNDEFDKQKWNEKTLDLVDMPIVRVNPQKSVVVVERTSPPKVDKAIPQIF